MPNALPPLTALRAFEAAARHMSFSKAAGELNVTPAALSFQIKSLEDHLGQRLFHRLNRAVELTEAGRALSPGMHEGMRAIRGAWRATQRLQETSSLTITAGPAFTAKWLSPRLYAFAQSHPGVDLRFVATLRVLDFVHDEIDVAIRFGEGRDDGLQSQVLMEEFLTPMMSPALAVRYGTADALTEAPLLHDDSLDFLRPRANWHAWLRHAEITRDTELGPRFSQADHALDAAISGGGVVLGRGTLAAGALRDGLLVAPFKLALTTTAKFRLLHQKGAETRPNLGAFLSWIRSESRAVDSLRAHQECIALRA